MALRSFLSSHDISHFTSPPHTPEHNGIAKRKHRHIVETGLTLLHQSSLPVEYWIYAFAAAVYLINHLPSQITDAVSPYEKLFSKSPNYLKLRVFGCLCFPWLKPYTKNKLENRSLPCIFMGYSLTQSAYLCLHLPTGCMYVSRHVQFVETQLPILMLFDLKLLRQTPHHHSSHHLFRFQFRRYHSYNTTRCLPRAEVLTCNIHHYRCLMTLSCQSIIAMLVQVILQRLHHQVVLSGLQQVILLL